MTRLQEALLDPDAKRSQGPLRAFRLARKRWWRGQRVELSPLADELGITRVTLYRWVGSREQLLVEIIWSLADMTFRYRDREIDETGAERLVLLLTNFVGTVTAHPGMSFWLANEGESAMRLLTRYETDFQPRLVNRIRDEIEGEIEAGNLDLPVPPEEVAYAIEQLIESYVYLEFITGEPTGARNPEPILRLLLT